MPNPWDLPPRLRNKVTVSASTDCWLWTGSRNNKGYGQCVVAGVPQLAHRRSYEVLIGPIPDGLTIDHLCRVNRCLNPEHLEPVTIGENLRRAADLIQQTEHYPCGHPRTPENTQLKNRNDGARPGRYCKQCARILTRRWRAARKAEQATSKEIAA